AAHAPATGFPESGLARLLGLAQRGIKPGPGERPVAIGGTSDDSQGPGRLIERQPREETELDQLGTGGIFFCQPVQGLVEDEESVRRVGEREVEVIQAQSPPATAALEPAAGAGAI